MRPENSALKNSRWRVRAEELPGVFLVRAEDQRLLTLVASIPFK